MNAQELIEYAKANEQAMVQAIKTFHPYYRDLDRLNRISAPKAEILCEEIRQEIKEDSQFDTDPVAQYKMYNPDTIVQLANSVWFGMPESFESRSHPAFYTICNLAEGYEEC